MIIGNANLLRTGIDPADSLGISALSSHVVEPQNGILRWDDDGFPVGR